MQQFLNSNNEEQLLCPFPSSQRSVTSIRTSSSYHCSSHDKKQYEKQSTKHRIGLSFRNSWGRKDSEGKHHKKNNSQVI